MQLIDLGVVAKGPITAEELASKSGADVVLVGELGKCQGMKRSDI